MDRKDHAPTGARRRACRKRIKLLVLLECTKDLFEKKNFTLGRNWSSVKWTKMGFSTDSLCFSMNMKFSIYDIFVLEIIRKEKRWIAFRIGEGVKMPEGNLIVTQDLEESELITFIEDMFHEFAQPGKSMEILE